MTSLIKLLVIAVLLLPLFSTNSHAHSTKQQIEELKQQNEKDTYCFYRRNIFNDDR